MQPFTFPSDFTYTKYLFIHQQSSLKIHLNSPQTLLCYSVYEWTLYGVTIMHKYIWWVLLQFCERITRD